MERLLKKIDGQKFSSHPTCFYLKWVAESPSARWLSWQDVPKDELTFSTQVKWKDLRYDVLLVSDTKNTQSYTVETENPYRNLSFLKSHLQKTIRRSNRYKALKTAWHMIDINLIEFLRRLAIIALEDALPLDGYAILIWFLAAVSKGYIMSDAQICWCLGYVHDLAACEYYEQFDQRELPSLRDMRIHQLPDEGKNLIYSILLRQSYGGMKSDQGMCRNSALIWANRFHTKSRYLELLQRKNKYITPPDEPLQQQEWILAAIDFHCVPNIISAMWEKHDQYTEEQIKAAIWHASSSVTDKKRLTEDFHQREPDKYADIWKIIKKDVTGYAKFMLEKQG